MKKILKLFRRLIFIILGKDVFYFNQIKCKKERHGSKNGGWTICNEGIDKNSIIYSFGIGTDISFELSLIERYQANIHCFDPTPRSIQWVKKQNLPEQIKLHKFGIADKEGLIKFYPPENPNYISHSIFNHGTSDPNFIELPVKKLDAIMQELNHPRINLLKMDIEGSEYGVIEDIINTSIRIDQLLIEFHHRFSNVGLQKTRNAIQKLNQNNYKIFYSTSLGEEYCFIKKIAEF